MYGLNFERRILDKILYEADSGDIPLKLLNRVLNPFLGTGKIIDSFH
jgi:hypothetical protein